MRRSAGIIAMGLLAACAPERLVGSEPWRRAPDVRIAVIAEDKGMTVRALTGVAPLERELAAPEDAEVWLFAYSAATLEAEFPGLAALPHEALAAALGAVPGNQDELPPPADEVLSVSLVGGVSYRARSWADWSQRSPSGLSFSLRMSATHVCGETMTSSLAGPPGVMFDGVTAVTADHLLLTGRVTGDPTIQLYALEDGRFRKLQARTELANPNSRPSWDPTTQSAWDVDGARAIVRFGLEGEPLPVPDPPADPDVEPQVVMVGAGRDGTVMATYWTRVVEKGEVVLAPVLFRHQATGWALAQAKARYGRFLVVRRERVAAIFSCWLYDYLDPREPNGWKQSLFDPGCNQQIEPSITDFDLDDDGGVSAGPRRFVYLRDEEQRAWNLVNDDLPDVDFLTATALGPRRAMITDAEGHIFVHRGRRWCPVPRAQPLRAVRSASAPGSGVAYLLGEGDPVAGTGVVRVELR